MHGLHDREDDLPVGSPGRSAVHLRRLLQRHRDIYQITGVEQYVHRHIEHYIQQDYAEPVSQSQLCRLFCQRHHQDRKRHEHTADDEQIHKAVELAVSLVTSQRITHQGMNRDGQSHGRYRDQ